MSNPRYVNFHIGDRAVDPNTPAGMADLCSHIDSHGSIGRTPPPVMVSNTGESGPIAFELLAAETGEMLLQGGILDDALADVHKISVRVPPWAPAYEGEDAAGVGEDDIIYPPRPDVMTIYTGLDDWDFRDAARDLGDSIYLGDDWYEAIDQASRLWVLAGTTVRTIQRRREAAERDVNAKPGDAARWPIWTVNEDLRNAKIPRRTPEQIARLRAQGDPSVSRGPSA